ncbi:MAG TPA: GIY-YIG nuclease family protein, partial [Chitinophagaceae bacterium]|nr:GIY-YIG nuclease family protein [Chitinophagaceae bacterium]
PMFYTYIIKSEKDNGYYFGYTSDVDERLNRHNACKVKSTKARRPFIIYYCETFSTKQEAFQREKYFKSFESRQWLKANNII